MRYSYVGHAGLAVALGGITAAIAGPAWATIILRARRHPSVLPDGSGEPRTASTELL